MFGVPKGSKGSEESESRRNPREELRKGCPGPIGI